MAANPKTDRRRVRCVINGKELDVWEGYRLWDAAFETGAGLWKWCGGDGFCATCAVIPVSGAENLTPPTKLEKFSLALWFLKPLALVRKRWKGRGVRLACQSYVQGPVEVVGVLGKDSKRAQQAYGLESE
jgi:ferredoxin